MVLLRKVWCHGTCLDLTTAVKKIGAFLPTETEKRPQQMHISSRKRILFTYVNDIGTDFHRPQWSEFVWWCPRCIQLLLQTYYSLYRLKIYCISGRYHVNIQCIWRIGTQNQFKTWKSMFADVEDLSHFLMTDITSYRKIILPRRNSAIADLLCR